MTNMPVNFRAAARMVDARALGNTGLPRIRSFQVEFRPRPLLPEPRERKSRLLPTPWPKVGDRDLQLGHSDLFLSQAWRDRFAPGDARLIYAAGCPGLGALSKLVHLPTYKVSTTSETGLRRRMFELRRDEVGAWRFQEGQYVRDEGWDRWFPSHLYPLRGPSPNSPVTVRERALFVRLPITMSPTEFDDEFDAEVRKGGLDLWAMTPEARNHCHFLGVDPNRLQRFTHYPDWAVMPAQEIVGFSIYSGADRLIRIAEGVILAHLELAPPSAA